ncbi:MAG: biotin transporter BioY [Acutalibacteraceae bacterium]|jgi:biotin transport system substrate-specific component
MKTGAGKNFRAVDLVFTALFAALTAVCAVIAVPMPMTTVPVSLLVLGVYLTGALLEKKLAFLAELVYLLVGAVGIPVFSGFSSGVGVLFGPTGGYLLASPLMAFLIAWIIEPFRKRKNLLYLAMLVVGMVSALLVCYLFGTVWFCIYGKYTFLQGLGFCVVPFLVPDAIKLAAAVVVAAAVDTAFQKIRAHA